jgi:hypothetical protein
MQKYIYSVATKYKNRTIPDIAKDLWLPCTDHSERERGPRMTGCANGRVVHSY